MGPTFESQSSSVNYSPGRCESIGLALRSERSAFPFTLAPSPTGTERDAAGAGGG